MGLPEQREPRLAEKLDAEGRLFCGGAASCSSGGARCYAFHRRRRVRGQPAAYPRTGALWALALGVAIRHKGGGLHAPRETRQVATLRGPLRFPNGDPLTGVRLPLLSVIP